MNKIVSLSFFHLSVQALAERIEPTEGAEARECRRLQAEGEGADPPPPHRPCLRRCPLRRPPSPPLHLHSRRSQASEWAAREAGAASCRRSGGSSNRGNGDGGGRASGSKLRRDVSGARSPSTSRHRSYSFIHLEPLRHLERGSNII
jgi:hypothetical protein